MILANVKLEAVDVTASFGSYSRIELGQKGRGRNLMVLPCKSGLVLTPGLNQGYTIGVTKNGRPRINDYDDGKLYFLLSTEGGYTRRGNGWVGAYKENQISVQLLAKGNGADGDAGRIGYWDVVLIGITGNPRPEGDWFRIRTSGGGYGTDPQWICIAPTGFYLLKDTQEARDFADAQDLEFPESDDPTVTFKDVTR